MSLKSKITCFLGVLLLSFFFPSVSLATPSNIKDVISNPQLSYFARLDIGINPSDSLIKIDPTSDAPSVTTNNLFIGDTIAIGDAAVNGPLTLYTIKGIGNTVSLQLNAGVGQSNAVSGAAVISTRSAIHTFSFTPDAVASGGFWQFLIKATSKTGETNNDGIPDQQGFDLGKDVGSTTTGLGTQLKLSDVECPNWGIGITTAYSIGSTQMPDGNLYHIITCYLGIGGTNQIGVGYSAIIGRDLSVGSQLINPSSSSNSRQEGVADVYTIYLRQLNSSLNIVSSVKGKIAVVEAVRVTADIDPTLTFSIGITNVGAGGTPCGTTLGGNADQTTADSVAYGSISLSTANDLAQQLNCVTNAGGGYVVTVYEQSPMANIASGNTIPDTDCDGWGCTTVYPSIWSSFTKSGWGYTLQNINVGDSIFNYQEGYRPFGIGPAGAQQIMSNHATPITNEQAYICYRLSASPIQEAGSYESKLVYTATATF
jgi:hypothetical protein